MVCTQSTTRTDSSHLSFEQLVKDRILSVLGMNDTRIALSENEITNVNNSIYI